jgi:hypothetical protein
MASKASPPNRRHNLNATVRLNQSPPSPSSPKSQNVAKGIFEQLKNHQHLNRTGAIQLNATTASPHTAALNPRAGANARMRDLIVNNFLKKYLASQEDSGEQISGLNYSRLQRALADHVDEYLSASTTRSVKVLEDQLWAIGKRFSGNRPGLPQIDLNSSVVIQSSNNRL